MKSVKLSGVFVLLASASLFSKTELETSIENVKKNLATLGNLVQDVAKAVEKQNQDIAALSQDLQVATASSQNSASLAVNSSDDYGAEEDLSVSAAAALAPSASMVSVKR